MLKHISINTYTLNLHSVECQLYFSKARRKVGLKKKKEDAKVTYRLGENICKSHILQRTCIWDIYHKNSQNSTVKEGKVGKKHEEAFHQRRYTDKANKHIKMFNIIMEVPINSTMRYG